MKTTTMKLLLGLLCIITLNLSAQSTANIHWGEEVDEPGGTWISSILKEENDGSIYALRLNKNAFGIINKAWIEKYSKDYSQTYSHELKFRDVGKGLNLEDVIVLGDGLVMIFTRDDKGANKLESYGLMIDKETGIPAGDLVHLATLPGTNLGKGEYYKFKVSADTTKLLVLGHDARKRKQHEKFKYWVYDQDLKKVWEKEFDLTFETYDYFIQDVQISNSGNAYMLAKVYSGDSHYEVIEYDYRNDKEFNFQITFDHIWLGDVSMVVNQQDQVVVVGFHGAGAYYARIDLEESKVIAQNPLPFDKKLLLDFMHPKSVAKGYNLHSFEIGSLIMKPDGGVILLAEQQWIEEKIVENKSSYTKHTTRFYYYRDILYLNISANGKLISHGAIYKSQRTVDDEGFYSSYAFGFKDDMLYIIYNDSERNFDERLEDKYYMNNPKKAVTVIAEVNANGQVKKSILYNNKEDLGSITRPRVFYSVEGYSILLAVKGNKMRLGKIIY